MQPEPGPEPEPIPSEREQRESMGLPVFDLDQEALRSYIIVAYASRFNTPAEEHWSGIIFVLIGEGIPMTAKTIHQIFRECQRESSNPITKGLII
jgi:hypothetical protein